MAQNTAKCYCQMIDYVREDIHAKNAFFKNMKYLKIEVQTRLPDLHLQDCLLLATSDFS